MLYYRLYNNIKRVIKSEQSINVDRMEQAVSLFGSFDEIILIIEKSFGVDVISRGSDI